MSKEDSIYNAKLAEQAERYEDMVKYMKEIVSVRLNTNCRLVQSYRVTTAISSVWPIRTGSGQEEQLGAQ